MTEEEKRGRIAVLGASGAIGRRIVERLLAEGEAVVCQTRRAETLADVASRAEIRAFDPRDPAALRAFVSGARAVIFALGVDTAGRTTLFSDVTAALLPAMSEAGVRRLIAITGVGVKETRGHGGFFYDHIIFPLFTRRRYADKDRQEALILDADLDWVIVRPAAFTDARGPGPLQILTQIGPGDVLTQVSRDEVADFVVAQIDSDAYVRAAPFIGRR